MKVDRRWFVGFAVLLLLVFVVGNRVRASFETGGQASVLAMPQLVIHPTPTPTPIHVATPTPTPTPVIHPTPTPTPTPTPVIHPTPTPTPTPTPAPRAGCSPGFWIHHTSQWVGFSPSATLGSVFTGVDPSLSSETLVDALGGGGGPDIVGKETILFRQAVAALLNATKFGSGFPLTTSQIISQVNAAIVAAKGGNLDALTDLADTLDGFNNIGCPLD